MQPSRAIGAAENVQPVGWWQGSTAMRGNGLLRTSRTISDETADLFEDGLHLGRHAKRPDAHGGAAVPRDGDHELACVPNVYARPAARPRPEPGLVE